jgi:hypothetical protein
LNKSNVLAIGVLLIALGLYLQIAYNTEENVMGKYLKSYIGEGNSILLVTILFWAGLIVVIVSIIIRPKRRRIVIPTEAVEAPQEGKVGVEYGTQEVAGTVEESMEHAYEEEASVSEEAPEEVLEEVRGEADKHGKLGEVIGFCPRCGAPVTEGIRYCRKCGLKLK